MTTYFEKKYLLGVTFNNELIFGNLNLKPDGRFSASFDTVYPQILTDELIENAVESRIDCLDSKDILSFLNDFDCRPSELVENLINSSYNILDDYFDNSLYCEVFDIAGNEIFFESSCCGQHDTRNELDYLFVKTDFYDYIHSLWDNYHLKELPVEHLNNLINYFNEYDTVDSDSVVETWLTEVWLPENS